MSPAVVAATLAAGDLALMLLEVPTGWLADRYGHRLSLIVGSVAQVVGMLCCWLGEGVPGLITASVLVAAGDAFRSGADQALAYRSCVALGREADFQAIQSRTEAVRQAALVGLVLAGGVIVSRWGFAAGWIAETVLCATGVLIAWAMYEPPPDEASESPATHTVEQASDANNPSRFPVHAHVTGGIAGRRGVDRVVPRANNRRRRAGTHDDPGRDRDARGSGRVDAGDAVGRWRDGHAARAGRSRRGQHSCRPRRFHRRSCRW